MRLLARLVILWVLLLLSVGVALAGDSVWDLDEQVPSLDGMVCKVLAHQRFNDGPDPIESRDFICVRPSRDVPSYANPITYEGPTYPASNPMAECIGPSGCLSLSFRQCTLDDGSQPVFMMYVEVNETDAVCKFTCANLNNYNASDCHPPQPVDPWPYCPPDIPYESCHPCFEGPPLPECEDDCDDLNRDGICDPDEDDVAFPGP